MRFNDAITGSVLVIFALAEIAYTQTFPSLFGQKYGPALFPQIIGYGLIATGTLLIVRGIKQQRNAGPGSSWIEPGEWVYHSRHKINFFLVLLALLSYILLSNWLGFIIISMIILFVMLYRLGSSVTTSFFVAAAATATLQLLFSKLLLVPLPAGLLQGLVY